MYMHNLLKRVLCAVLSAGLMITSASFTALAEDMKAPVISVTFDEGSDAYTLHDGGELADGRDGKALSLNGNGAYADINGCADTLKALDGDFSISIWLNPSSAAVWARPYDIGIDTDKYVFLTVSSGSHPRFAIKNGTEQFFDSDTTFTTGEWHNAVITRKNGVSAFFIDGFSVGSSSAITHNISDLGTFRNCYLGKSQWPDPYFDGMLDDFKVFDYALTENEVQTIAAEAYEAKRNQILYEKNCYTVETHFYDKNGSEIFARNQQDNIYISNISIADSNAADASAAFTIHNAKGADTASLTAYVAQYNADKTLAKIDMTHIGEITSDEQAVTIPYTTVESADKTELFVWNGMKPVSRTAPAAEEVTVKVSIENNTFFNDNVAINLMAHSGADKVNVKSDAFSLSPLEKSEKTYTVPAEYINDTISVDVTTPTAAGRETDTAAYLFNNLHSPVAAPADTYDTTFGVHDPSIVKFPGDDTYYVYSSHHIIYTSKDLINWKKYDFSTTLTTNPDFTESNGTKPNASKKQILSKTFDFISKNINSNVNGTYWAPDVIYKAGDSHPYRMYISVSCGLGGRNSAIALIKSDNPLFWADESADIIDEGVVFATKHESGYKTNAIDANIYTDTDGTQYFVWGSFWGGIQAAKLKDDGFVEGVDYSSDAAVISSCRNFGTTVYSQKNGAAGPEGAWMLDKGNYRYMFTSYGWLGSNYNTRVARSPLSASFGTDTGLVDANGYQMGNQYNKGSLSSPSGYKLIGSYRLGDGSMDIVHDGNNEYYYPYTSDSAHIYYGPGHNSAINRGDESFYVSHVRKDAIEGAAWLQVRKMLYTADGWPVVSPVTYAGEVEQPLPLDMLMGTYDLASVGHTIMDGSQINTGTNPNRNYDLPVLSSKIKLVLNGSETEGPIDDGSSNRNLGTWKFDGDHTLTLEFKKDGDESKHEFYKADDVMTMYALFGYDKDTQKPVIALTGTDQKHITQFAKKELNVFSTTPQSVPEPEH